MKRFIIRNGKSHDCKTYVYIMQDRNGCKFGITNSLERRQQQYSETRPSLKLKYYKLLHNRNIARLIEFKMKIKFPILREFGYETTDTSLISLIEFIENSELDFEKAILALPEDLQPLK